MRLTICLFGSFDIRLDGVAVTGFRSNKARALLAYLATEANRPIPRATLATILWGDYPEAQARKSLRNTIANLRQILAPAVEANNLLIDRHTLQLTTQTEGCVVDVIQFDELMKTAQSVTSAESTTELFVQAVSLYQGELLAGLSPTDSVEFEDWRRIQQEVRHRQLMTALNQLTESLMASHEYEGAQTYARQQLQIEPWHEGAHRQLIQLLAATGDRSAALAQYATCQKVLNDELGVEPDAETIALYEQIRDGTFTSSPRQSLPPSPAHSGIPTQPSSAPIPNRYEILSRLDPMPDQKLFGIERARLRLMEVLLSQERPWLMAIDGIGGIGKTTLATLLIHKFLGMGDQEEGIGVPGVETGAQGSHGGFENIAWVSAKQEEFRPAVGIAAVGNGETGKPALDVESLTDGLLEQLMVRPPLTASSEEKQTTLLNLLKAQPILVVVDNLETVADYQALVPYLRQLANPSKFLITTRFSLQSYSDIFCYSLTELEEADALAFLRHEAEVRNIGRLANASHDQLADIYRVVGGNPLALKLVIGQVSFLSLSQVLENLQEAQGKRIDQLYVYIYWQAWEMLDDMARQLFLSMPAVDDGTFMELSFASALDPDEMQDALSQLMNLSLVQVGGDLDEPRYRLHRLTETFLMNEVLKWQSIA
ncbi:MAG: BTAD domain-containing putative transcriptional regulator [Chloroflexota bacterium]